MKIIYTKNAAEAIGPYSQGIIANGMLFTSGQIPLKPTGELVENDIEKQTHQVFKNIKAILEAADCTLQSVAKATIYLKNIEDFNKVNEIYGYYFDNHKPARSCVEVSRLPKDVLIEVDIIATLP